MYIAKYIFFSGFSLALFALSCSSNNSTSAELSSSNGYKVSFKYTDYSEGAPSFSMVGTAYYSSFGKYRTEFSPSDSENPDDVTVTVVKDSKKWTLNRRLSIFEEKDIEAVKNNEVKAFGFIPSYVTADNWKLTGSQKYEGIHVNIYEAHTPKEFVEISPGINRRTVFYIGVKDGIFYRILQYDKDEKLAEEYTAEVLERGVSYSDSLFTIEAPVGIEKTYNPPRSRNSSCHLMK